MQWTFQLRGKEVTLAVVEETVAVRPREGLRARTATRSAAARDFGRLAKDDRDGRTGLDLPVRSRHLFERAGWLFVEPQPEVERAAFMTRTTVRGAETVQQVFVDRGGNLQVTTDILTVQMDPEMTESQVQERLTVDGLTVIRRLSFATNTFEASATDQRPLPELIHTLQSSSYYRFAEPMLLQAITGRLKPTDPRYPDQWQHANDGSNGGVAGADIHAEQAWDRTRGRGATRPVRIAIIDNGMQVDHPDLQAAIVGGGYFESSDVGTTTFVRLQTGGTDFPDVSHGTFCMGMAGARMNNGRGGCGSAPEADLIAIACLKDQIGTQTTLARAVAYAANPGTEDAQATVSDGAEVIVCSLGPNNADWDLTSILDLAIQSAANGGRGGAGCPLFWATSNGPFPIAGDEVSSHPDVIAVGRSNRMDQTDGSAFGPKLEFLAPGRDVFNTRSGSGYRFWTGTSFAAPLAAGVGALVLAVNPNWTAGQVRERLRETCDRVGGVNYDANGHHDRYGYGRINAARAVE
ncbi:MAG: hypothetical protein FJX77_00360 [Armatimonadetes bacterium]|nr:hypothetical protein [Armatimonadota bacterium]